MNTNVWIVGTATQRVAGLDDYTAICANCGGLMLRLDEDPFTPYFAVPILSQEEIDDHETEKSGSLKSRWGLHEAYREQGWWPSW